MTLDKIRDLLLILAALAFIWFYGFNWMLQHIYEKGQLAQKVQQLEKQLTEKAKEGKK